MLRTWACKYQALADGPPNACVEGSAYEVTSKEHEDAFRSYETDNYEVVRCTISIAGRQVQDVLFDPLALWILLNPAIELASNIRVCPFGHREDSTTHPCIAGT